LFRSSSLHLLRKLTSHHFTEQYSQSKIKSHGLEANGSRVRKSESEVIDCTEFPLIPIQVLKLQRSRVRKSEWEALSWVIANIERSADLIVREITENGFRVFFKHFDVTEI
jgi:hypothetical protein